MKKLFLIFLAMFVGAVCVKAQTDEFRPGLYTVNGDEVIPLKYETGATENTEILDGVIPVNPKYIFRKPTSGTVSRGTFIFVRDPEKKAIVKTLNKYDVFIRTMDPDNMMLIPFAVKKNRRIYQNAEYDIVRGMELRFTKCDFTWEKTADNTYEIKADLAPGEYAFAFRINSLAPWDISTVYTFTIE